MDNKNKRSIYALAVVGVVTSLLESGMIDQSPCGTGTCAEAALRYAQGQLGLGKPFVTESIIGTRFAGSVIAGTQIGSGSEVYPSVVPAAAGSAYII